MDIGRIIKDVRHSHNAKGLMSNFVSLSLLQVANYVFPLITLPYLTKVVGVENFGRIAFAQAVIVWFQAIVDYGFIYSSVRDIARCREDIKRVSVIYSNVMWARFLLTGVSFVFLVFAVLFIPVFKENGLILFFTFFTVIGHAMFPEWLFQAFERMKYVTVLNVLTKLIFTVMVFLVIKSEGDYYLQPILMSLGYVCSGLISFYIISRWGIRFLAPDISQIIDAIKRNTDLFINQIVPNLYSNLSVILLGVFHGQTANGIFDLGRKFDNVSLGFLSVISRVFFPFLSRNPKRHRIYSVLQIGLSCVIAIFLFVFAPLIIDIFFTANYRESVVVIRVLSISIIAQSLLNVYGTNYLILKGYEREMRISTLHASIVGLLIAVPCVYYFSYIGVAITIACSRSLIALLVVRRYFIVKRIDDEK